MYESRKHAPDLGLHPAPGRPAGHRDQLDTVAHRRPALTATAAMDMWRALLGIVRRTDAIRQALSRLDATGIRGIYRQAVETELAEIQDLLATQANNLTVSILQAEVARRNSSHGA